jgi:hypothetical protein
MAISDESFPEELLTLIWSCCSAEKHEDIVRATYELIVELAGILSISRLQSLYQRVSSIDLNHIDDKKVIFLKDYTINTLLNLRNSRVRE